ncbi:MAG: arylesterase [Hyphomonadaceae bacterium]
MHPVIVMLGDSLTAGYGLPPRDALPEQLQTRLDRRAIPATIVNAGVSGDTTRGGLERYGWSVSGAGADILIVALGANDFLMGLSADQTRKNLSAIIERAREDGVAVALVGVAMHTDRPDSRERSFAAVYRDLSSKYGVPLFPDLMAPVSGRAGFLQQDGLHPTSQGVGLVADNLEGFVADRAIAWRKAHPNTP